MADAGALALIVGPSGAGKDTLIGAARVMLSTDRRFFFPQRDITRPAEAGGEAHNAVSFDLFHARVESGGYALHWHAHGLGYGVPVTVFDALAEGRTVVVNVSRGVIDAGRAMTANVRVVNVVASHETLTKRLTSRGRETTAEIAARVVRADAYEINGEDVFTIRNDTTVEDGAVQLIQFLRSL